MKNQLKTILLLSLFFISSGCDKSLDDIPVLNAETAITGFITESDADQSITAIYSDIKTRDGLNGRNVVALFDMSTADLKMIREPNKINNYTFNTSTDDVQAFEMFWKKMYSIIGRCNISLEAVPKTSSPVAKISRYNSEAKVLRAMMYFYLMMAYNNCPLVLKTVNPGSKEDVLIADASRAEIYSAMIKDLEEVLVNPSFPWEKNLVATELGHVGQATARTLLTYYYLTRGWETNNNEDFLKAKTISKQVIDNGGYSLEPELMDAYYKNFSKESIFELSGSNIERGFGNYLATWFAPLTAPAGADRLFYGGWNKMAMTQHLYDDLGNGDSRRYLLANGAKGDNKFWAPKFLGGAKYGGPILIVDNVTDDVSGKPVYQSAKATGSPLEWRNRLNNADGVASNWVIYRLSDVYLLYAEACLKTGDETGARTYINLVRQRARNAWTATLPAGNPDIPAHVSGIPADIGADVSGDNLLKVLKRERRVELFTEQKRMLDLRRWSLGGAKDLENEVNIVGTWSNKYKWFPKPQTQIDLSGGLVKQNEGY
jgi:hypothetical protein